MVRIRWVSPVPHEEEDVHYAVSVFFFGSVEVFFFRKEYIKTGYNQSICLEDRSSTRQGITGSVEVSDRTRHQPGDNQIQPTGLTKTDDPAG